MNIYVNMNVCSVKNLWHNNFGKINSNKRTVVSFNCISLNVNDVLGFQRLMHTSFTIA